MRRLLLAAASMVCLAAPARAQGVFERLGLDRLQLAALGVAMGRIDPTQVEAATVFAITAEYGNIAPRWRLVFSGSYWESRMSDDVVQAFIDTLRSNVDDPTGDYTVAFSRVPLYDVTIGVGFRWSPWESTFLHPYGGFGVSAHVINAEGRLIKGTFVERSLDNIAAGMYAATGVELRLLRSLMFDGEARVDMLSGFRAFQLRVGATYYLPPPRRTGP